MADEELRIEQERIQQEESWERYEREIEYGD